MILSIIEKYLNRVTGNRQKLVTFPGNSRPTEVERPPLITKHRMEATDFPQIIKQKAAIVLWRRAHYCRLREI